MNCDGKMTKIGCISAVSGGFCHFCGHFLDVEGDGEECKVHGDLVFAEVPEALVVHVVLHLPEHGLGLYGSLGAVFEPFLGVEVFPCPLLVGDEPVADLDLSVTSFLPVTLRPQRAAMAALCAVGGHLDDVAALSPVVACAHAPHVLSHRADEVVALGIVVQVLDAERVIAEGALLLHVEVFWIFISVCNIYRNEYTPKLKGTKKCNWRFVDFGANASSFSIIKTIQDLTIR